MNHNTHRFTFAFACTLAATLAAGSARAAESEGSSGKKIQVGALLLPMPAGSISGLGGSSQGTAFAFGFQAVGEYRLHEYFSLGLSPRVVLNVKGSDAQDGGTEIDLLLRATGWYPVASRIEVYGFLAPGYSTISVSGASSSASGLALGFGAGGQYKLNDTIYLAGELGYQLGFQKIEQTDFNANFFHIGLGAGTRF